MALQLAESTCVHCGLPKHLRELGEEQPQWFKKFKTTKREKTQSVPTKWIVGSVDGGGDFASDWSPFLPDVRYSEILQSMKGGFKAELSKDSPICLLKVKREYWVEDEGHRRVSVAHRLQIPMVEAQVIILVPSSTRARIPCPRCGEPCEGVYLKMVKNNYKVIYHYWYAAHYQPRKPKTPKWCYVGKTKPQTRESD